MKDFRERANEAKKSLFVQAMTFEGDSAGEELIDIMASSPAKDKRLLVDSYSKAVINDSFIFSPKYLKDKAFRQEVKNTRRILKSSSKYGIEVKLTNPLGFFMLRYPLRNHKKMVVVDEQTTYLGGINFSDHNFEWHDMMVAIESRETGSIIAADFNKTWNGENQSTSIDVDDSTIYFFNGIKSSGLYEKLFDKIRKAKKSVEIISPYISNPLLGVLKQVPKEVEVSIISPAKNNKSVFKDILLSELQWGYFRMFEYPGMSHLKAILIDGETLLFGSSNYDIVSYYWEQEVVLETTNQKLIEEFKNIVLMPAKDRCVEISDQASLESRSLKLLKIVEWFCRISSKSFLKPH